MSEEKLPYIPPLEEGQKERKCKKHDGPLGMNCKTCKTLICIKCTQTTHREHDCDFWKPSNHTDVALSLIDGAIEKGKSYKQSIQSASTRLENDFQKLLDTIRTSKSEREKRIKKEEKSLDETLECLRKMKINLKSRQNIDSSVEMVLQVAHEPRGELHELEKRISNLVPKPADSPSYLLDPLSHQGGGVSSAQCCVSSSYPLVPNRSGWEMKTEFNLKRMGYVATLHAQPRNLAWCRQHHNKILYVYTVEGDHDSSREVNFKDGNTGDFSVLNNRIIYCNFQKNSISLASQLDGKEQQFRDIFSTAPSIPLGICTVKSGNDKYDVYIGLTDNFNRKPSKEIRSVGYFTLNGSNLTDTTKRYQRCSSSKNVILSYPYRIAHNTTNNALCVVDQTSPSSGRVVILHRLNIGTVIGTYKGKEQEKTFDPRDVCCDSNGEIIVSDTSNSNVHVLNEKGAFLRLLMDPESRELPRSVSVSNDLLWIGCENGKIIILKKV